MDLYKTLLLTLYLFASVTADFKEKPRNKLVPKESTVRLKCRPGSKYDQATDTVYWRTHLSRFSNGWDEQTISTNKHVNLYHQYMAVDTREQIFDLIFTKTATSDTNIYSCCLKRKSNGLVTWFNASSFLLVSDVPKCSFANGEKNYKENSFMKLVSSAYNKVFHIPELNPIIQWYDNTSSEIPTVQDKSLYYYLNYFAKVVAQANIDGLLYTSKMFYKIPPKLPSNAPNLTLDTHVPKEKLQCQLLLDVLFQLRDLVVINPKKVYYPGEKIRCQARGNPRPSYFWKTSFTHSNGSKKEIKINGSDILVTKNMVGRNDFECVAMQKCLYNWNNCEILTLSFTFTVEASKAGTQFQVGLAVGLSFLFLIIIVIIVLLTVFYRQGKLSDLDLKKVNLVATFKSDKLKKTKTDNIPKDEPFSTQDVKSPPLPAPRPMPSHRHPSVTYLGNEYDNKHEATNDLYMEPDDMDTYQAYIDPIEGNDWEIPEHLIKLETKLGEGRFGEVWKAQYQTTISQRIDIQTVAVKRLKGFRIQNEQNEFIEELSLMKTLPNHMNVLKLIGCCTNNGPIMIVTEYLSGGDLHSFLTKKRVGSQTYERLQNNTDWITSRDLIQFSLDVASGMTHLEAHGVIHRDLAARNILLSEKLVCKVSDFGLARNLQNNEVYSQTKEYPVPMRWMAPESLISNQYTTKSDIWSFGILLWEITMLGCLPYADMSTRCFVEKVQRGYLMPKPIHCSQEVYNLMVTCWQYNSFDRPTFSSLKQRLRQMKDHSFQYIDLNQLKEPQYTKLTSDDGFGLPSHV